LVAAAMCLSSKDDCRLRSRQTGRFSYAGNEGQGKPLHGKQEGTIPPRPRIRICSQGVTASQQQWPQLTHPARLRGGRTIHSDDTWKRTAVSSFALVDDRQLTYTIGETVENNAHTASGFLCCRRFVHARTKCILSRPTRIRS
jgi:hypothetical protein